MTSRLKLKLITAALALTSALGGVANAALVDGSGGNGSLVLFAWDETDFTGGNQRAYVQALGPTLSSFDASGARVSDSGFNQQFTLDPLFFTAFAGANTANIKWNVVSVGNGPNKMLTTQSTATNPAATNSALNNGIGVVNGFISNLNNFDPNNPATTSSANCSGSAVACFVNDDANYAGTFFNDATYGSNYALTMNGLNSRATGLSAVQAFYEIDGGSGNTNPATIKRYKNSTFNGQWDFVGVNLTTQTGKIEYNLAAVPEPSAWLMMALGLVGLVGVAGRRMRGLEQF
jgi:hypothetical protein